MKLTDELFKNYKLIEKTLISYGFFHIDNKYFLNALLYNKILKIYNFRIKKESDFKYLYYLIYFNNFLFAFEQKIIFDL